MAANNFPSSLNELIPILYNSTQTVSRELCGMIPAVTMDAQTSTAALGQELIMPIASLAGSSVEVKADSQPPDSDGGTVGSIKIAITKSHAFPIRWTGEEQAAINRGGTFELLLQAQFSQAMRTLTNEIEADLCALHTKASRAYSTASGAPFAIPGDYSDSAQARKILMDNGAPTSDLQLVLDTAAGANLRGKQAQAHIMSDASMLRQGVLLSVHGFDIRESAQIVTPTFSTMTGAKTTSASAAVGQTIIPLAAAGSGAVVPGDVITFSGDTNQYVVATTTLTTGSITAGNTITIAAPGLRKKQTAACDITVATGAKSRNLAFSRSAILLATRVPITVGGGDMAQDRTIITDPVSGLSFEVSSYRQYRQVRYEVAICWGVACLNPEHVAVLLG